MAKPEGLKRAEAHAERYADELAKAASEYTKGAANFAALAEAAKKYTNAMHKVGRELKATADATPNRKKK